MAGHFLRRPFVEESCQGSGGKWSYIVFTQLRRGAMAGSQSVDELFKPGA